MLHFKEKIYQICGCIAGILFAIFGFINAAGLRGTGLEKIYIISFNVVYGCIILLSLFLVFSEEKGSAASAVLLFAVLAGSFSVFLSQPFFGYVNFVANTLGVFQFALFGVSATFAFLTIYKYGQSPARAVALKRNIQLGNGIFNTVHFSSVIIFCVIWMFNENNSIPVLYMLYLIAFATLFLTVSIMLIKPPERTKNGFEQRRALDLILLAYYFFAFIGVNPTDAEVPIFENGLIYLVYAASAVLCVVSLSLSSRVRQKPTSSFTASKLRFAAMIFCLVRASFAVLDFFNRMFFKPEIIGNMYWQLILSVILLVSGAVTLAHSSENKKSIFISYISDIVFIVLHVAIVFVIAILNEYKFGTTSFSYFRNPALCAVTISLLCVSLYMSRKKRDAIPAEKTENEIVGATVESQ